MVREVGKRRTITRKRRKVKELKNFDEGVWERVGQSQERGENEVKEKNEVEKIKKNAAPPPHAVKSILV